MKSFSFVFVLLVAIIITASPANPEASSGTALALIAHWDNNHPVEGTVTLVQANSSSSNSLIVAKPLSKGQASVTVPLARAVYNITLVESNGTQLFQFPITTALINPSNLTSAQISIVCRVADNSIASAQVNVLMNF